MSNGFARHILQRQADPEKWFYHQVCLSLAVFDLQRVRLPFAIVIKYANTFGPIDNKRPFVLMFPEVRVSVNVICNVAAGRGVAGLCHAVAPVQLWGVLLSRTIDRVGGKENDLTQV